MKWNWHASHLVTSVITSWRAVGQKKPCRKTLTARSLDPMWEPHMPPCISANSFSPSSREMHFNFTPFGLFCKIRYQRIGTEQTGVLLFLPLPAPQEVPLFGGIGWYDVPMPEPEARRQGLKAFPLPWERLSLRPGLNALSESVAPW